MKKVFYIATLAALAMTSCQTGELPDPMPFEAPSAKDSTAVTFDIYKARSIASRTLTSAQRQSITTPVLQRSEEGFGVFAYETGQQKFRSHLPNHAFPTFMYNQRVNWESPVADKLTDEYLENGEWRYNPVKYWPNDDSYITFQAYAPWHEFDENFLFDVKYKGVGVRYDVSENYDLLWGAKAFAGEHMVCFYDQRKPGITEKTLFHFKHALTKVDFCISYNSDDMECTLPQEKLDPKTHIVIRSIRLLGTLPSQGVLSLYDGAWTVEKVSEKQFKYDTEFFGYTNKIGNLEGAKYVNTALGQQPGVLTNKVPRLYANKSVMLIPSEDDVRFELSYDVVTDDVVDAEGKVLFPGHTKNITIVSDKIPSHWGNTHDDTSLETDEAAAGMDGRPGVFRFEAGKWTTINIHLGMTTVKLDADVQPWDQSESGSIDMPANKD